MSWRRLMVTTVPGGVVNTGPGFGGVLSWLLVVGVVALLAALGWWATTGRHRRRR